MNSPKLSCIKNKNFILDETNADFVPDEKLIKISDDIYNKYIDDGELKGFVKTSYVESPTEHEFLLLERNLKIQLTKLDPNYYIDDIKFEFGKYSRGETFGIKHQWDGVGIIFTFGLIIPFLLPKLTVDLYEYYNSEDYNYVDYDIKKRESNVVKN